MTENQQITLLKRQLKSIKRKRDRLKEEIKRHKEVTEILRNTIKWIGPAAKEYSADYKKAVKKEGDLSDLISIEFGVLAQAATTAIKEANKIKKSDQMD